MGLGSWLCGGAGVALAFGLATASIAQEPLPAAGAEVLLTVSGAIKATNAGDVAALDLAILEAMGTVEFETETIWTQGVQSFQGVPLVTLLDRLGAEGSVIAASALNDYTIEIPMSDAVEGGPIIAFRQNGEALSVRDKGPLWVVYPYDSRSEYQTEVIYARSIWQLARIEVK